MKWSIRTAIVSVPTALTACLLAFPITALPSFDPAPTTPEPAECARNEIYPIPAPSRPLNQPAEAPQPPKTPTKALRVRVTACSPADPPDLDYYRRNGYAGRLTNAVSADYRQFPKGTTLKIPGYAGDQWVRVDSPGGPFIRRSVRRGILHIDVKFRTLSEARQWGNRWLTVNIKED